MQDPIKEAFSRVKQEIDYMMQELAAMREELEALKNQQTNQQSIIPTQNPTLQHITPAQDIGNSNTPTIIPTLNSLIKPYNAQFPAFSTGNEGVPTNQPTNQQTNQHPNTSTATQGRGSFNVKIYENLEHPKVPIQTKELFDRRIDRLEKVSEILGSLDELKKEVRLKFKRLTNQEMSVYISIYQLEEQGFLVDYLLLAEKLGLTEISIRDYIRKIIQKGVPLNKIRENNKKIVLSVPQDLKKIASINTIIQLREL